MYERLKAVPFKASRERWASEDVPFQCKPRIWDWLRKRSEKQIPRGLKPARNDKEKTCAARLKSCPDTKRCNIEFFRKL